MHSFFFQNFKGQRQFIACLRFYYNQRNILNFPNDRKMSLNTILYILRYLLKYYHYYSNLFTENTEHSLTSFFFYINLFIYFWLCWVFVSVRGLSLVAVRGAHSSSQCTGLSLSQPLLLRSTGSRRTGWVVVAQGPSCSAACGIFPDQGSNPCPLHWQADSQPLRHQGSPDFFLNISILSVHIWYTSYNYL